MIPISALALCITACAGAPELAAKPSADIPTTAAVPDAVTIVAAADEAAGRDLWPDFAPRTTPVAIYDGARTLLFRHPAPPDGFRKLEASTGVWSFDGRHPLVVSNTSVMMGDVATATLMPGPGTSLERAGTLLHEAFHVFQRARHPGWSANEADLFLYPSDSPSLLALRRAESMALDRALRATDAGKRACWTRSALVERERRFAQMSTQAVAYERATELNEGLANYVELRAIQAPDAEVMPSAEFPPDAVRQRGYASGTALGRLLDRFAPKWRSELEANDEQQLDVMLRAALPGPGESCTFTPVERTKVQAGAERDVDALRTRRSDARREFLETPGWTIAVRSTSPLMVQNFDPWNFLLLGPSEVLHTRTVRLGNEAGTLESLGYRVLTEGTGEHPLFSGVAAVTIGGIEIEPKLVESDGAVRITSPEVTVEFKGAVITRDGQTVILTLR
jgi:hypothetical protein